MTLPRGRNRRIVLYGNPVLRHPALPVTALDADVRRLLADLETTMLEQDGLGLAANQIGSAVSVFAVNPRGADLDGPPYCLLNPRLTGSEGQIEREEGCLSLPGIYDVIGRPEAIRVAGIDSAGRPVNVEARGLLARTMCHEIDHLNGVLFIDHLGQVRRDMLTARLKEIEEQEAAEAECG